MLAEMKILMPETRMEMCRSVMSKRLIDKEACSITLVSSTYFL